MSQRGRAWLKHTDGGNLPLTDIIPSSAGGAFVGTALTERLSEFISNLEGVLQANQLENWNPSILFVGATGGVRGAMEKGDLSDAMSRPSKPHLRRDSC